MALLLASCGGSSGGGVTGTFSILPSAGDYSSIAFLGTNEVGQPCEGQAGYDDIKPGANVVVKDGHGAVIATGDLGDGRLELQRGPGLVCTFPFTLQVPGSDFYVFSVSDRGDVTYSKTDLEANDWKVELSLGG